MYNNFERISGYLEDAHNSINHLAIPRKIQNSYQHTNNIYMSMNKFCYLTEQIFQIEIISLYQKIISEYKK